MSNSHADGPLNIVLTLCDEPEDRLPENYFDEKANVSDYDLVNIWKWYEQCGDSNGLNE